MKKRKQFSGKLWELFYEYLDGCPSEQLHRQLLSQLYGRLYEFDNQLKGKLSKQLKKQNIKDLK